jgi:hypothetical protein
VSEEPEEEFSLSLKGAGISIEKTVDKHTALVVMSAVLGGAAVTARTAATNTPGKTSASESRPPMSVGEFLEESGATKNHERIAAVGLFLREHRGQEHFTSEHVRNALKAARQELPRNLSRDLSRTVKARWIEPLGSGGQFYVTSTGTRTVESKFGRSAKPA